VNRFSNFFAFTVRFPRKSALHSNEDSHHNWNALLHYIVKFEYSKMPPNVGVIHSKLCPVTLVTVDNSKIRLANMNKLLSSADQIRKVICLIRWLNISILPIVCCCSTLHKLMLPILTWISQFKKFNVKNSPDIHKRLTAIGGTSACLCSTVCWPLCLDPQNGDQSSFDMTKL